MEKRKALSGKSLLDSGKVQSFIFQFSIYVIPITLFCIFWIGINLNSVIMAFQNISTTGERSFAGFANFGSFIAKIVSGDSTLLRTSFLNSLLLFVLNFALSMPLYILFSFYLFKKLPGSRIFVIIVMIPSIVSEFVISLIFKRFVNVVIPGVFNQLWGITVPPLLADPRYTFGTTIFFMIWVSFATSLIVYPNAMRSIPGEIIESASIDGAGFWKEFWYIVFPLIFPTLSTFIVMGVAGIFTTTGPAVAFYQYNAYPEVYTVGYYFIALTMTATDETGYPEMAAGGLVLTIISCPLTFGIKYLMEKLTPETN